MEPTDLTVQILIEIRDEIRSTNGRIDQTNERLDQTNQRLDQTNQRLDQTRSELTKRLVESEVRTATAIHEVGGTMREVRDLLHDRLDLRDRVDRCERDIADLKHKVG